MVEVKEAVKRVAELQRELRVTEDEVMLWMAEGVKSGRYSKSISSDYFIAMSQGEVDKFITDVERGKYDI